MRKFNFFCSVILVLTLSIFIVTSAQNVLIRTTAAYTFYFNDSRVVSLVSSNHTNSEMAKEITGYFNSFGANEFQIYEDTGYDMEGIFEDEDNDNMRAAKKAADISLILCIISLIISVAIYVHFLKNDFKEVIRNRIKAVTAVTVILTAVEGILLKTGKGLALLMNTVGLETLSDHSSLKFLLGGEFISLAGTFLIAYTVIIYGVILYTTLVMTKPPRIFY